MRPVLAVIAAFALVVALLAWSRWLAGRRWAAAGHLLMALAATGVVTTGWSLANYLDTYEARVAERPLAELFFERVGANRYRVALTRLPSGRMQVVELVGHEWRLDLRALEWSDYAAHAGLAPRVRVEGLAARLVQAAGQHDVVTVKHNLADDDSSTPWLEQLGAGRGSPLRARRDLAGPWQPMAHGSRFDVRLTAANVIQVDPLNTAASDSLAAR